MTTNNHPAHGPVSLDRLHQISEILSKAAAQSDGGNLGYAMADAVKVIDVAIAAFNAEPVAYWRYAFRADGFCYADGINSKKHHDTNPLSQLSDGDYWRVTPLYAAPQSLNDAERAELQERRKADNAEPVADVVVWSSPNEERICDIRWRRFDVAPGPLYSAPPAPVVPPAIEPEYEVIKAILPTANPDEYACCIAADMWNACRAAMLQAGNSPVTPDGSEDTKRLDWLDAQNKRLNEYYGTSYGWKFDANFQRNAMMLNDSNYPVMNVRQAIDEAIAEAPKQENI
ncbi:MULTISPECIES: hypothetical protein [Citrobacter freundii complex]|uniref:hypothetical protein n=1 Tax=Citrobacter freundii complex TaxID=1344959 RepID=UPI00101BA16C|nr:MULTISPECIES: hypothetical protein [Citrobacter freundii complex]NTY82114.1 hypothetical protein [Citrobacter werkmanii]RYH71716.1 hypothetical protein EVY23_20140 [Citrobacter freundii]RZA77532.1 hypothetical protein EVY18_22060 [Citrobacter freundii]HCC5808916.1 hypothetical protein [Citrobacter freundii]HCC5830704.1 hypothetical protein [Citrobacter freundii]